MIKKLLFIFLILPILFSLVPFHAKAELSMSINFAFSPSDIDNVKTPYNYGKVGDKVIITTTLSQASAKITGIELSISDKDPARANVVHHKKASYPDLYPGQTKTYNYTWDTSSSEPGTHWVCIIESTGTVSENNCGYYNLSPAPKTNTNNAPTNSGTSTTNGRNNDATQVNQNADTTGETSGSGGFLGGLLGLNKDPADYTLDDVPAMIDYLQKMALAFGGGIAVIFILWGGWGYITAYGNEEAINKSKRVIIWAIIGLVIIILAEYIVYMLRGLIG